MHPTLPRRAIVLLASLALVLTAHLSAQTTPSTASSRPASPAPEPAPANATTAALENSVVKVFVTQRQPDPFKPWAKQSPRETSGTGIVIEGKRILTNAHLALYASQVQVQANQSGDKLPATVEFVAPGIDLAVLRLEDESFFDTHPPLARAKELPAVKDSVMVYGFPTGGTSLSITKGIVSRIEFANYSYPTSGLRIQIDAAINPGNSGGPALADDRMIGVAFSRLSNADNIGYIIPVEEVELFLSDIADGRYDGKPGFFDDLQTLQNPALRAHLRLDKATEGIVVHQPESTDPAYPLKPWDVITKIGDTPVDNEGMIKLGANLRVRFTYLVQHLARDGHVPLTVVRGGQTLPISQPAPLGRPMLIPNLAGDYPAYFICGPLVFTAATTQYLAPFSGNARALDASAYVGSPLVTRRGDRPAFPGEQLVLVASPFLPHRLAQGYSQPAGRVVQSVNGVVIRNLAHLVEVLRDAKDDYLVFAFAGRGGESPVFPRKDLLAATDDILNDNGIRAQGSPDLMAVWEKKQDRPAAADR